MIKVWVLIFFLSDYNIPPLYYETGVECMAARQRIISIRDYRGATTKRLICTQTLMR